jgi:hypothetical protein
MPRQNRAWNWGETRWGCSSLTTEKSPQRNPLSLFIRCRIRLDSELKETANRFAGPSKATRVRSLHRRRRHRRNPASHRSENARNGLGLMDSPPQSNISRSSPPNDPSPRSTGCQPVNPPQNHDATHAFRNRHQPPRTPHKVRQSPHDPAPWFCQVSPRNSAPPPIRENSTQRSDVGRTIPAEQCEAVAEFDIRGIGMFRYAQGVRRTLLILPVSSARITLEKSGRDASRQLALCQSQDSMDACRIILAVDTLGRANSAAPAVRCWSLHLGTNGCGAN